MSSIAVQPCVTPEEYLERERKAETKSEYVNGRIYAIAGASRQRNLIAGNVFAALHAQLKGRPCEAYVNDMRVKVSETGLYTYPDVSVVCGEPRFDDAQRDTLLNPTVLVEVLSDSTEAYDRGDKFAHYRRQPALLEYILISQVRPRVERFARQGAQWALTEADGLDAALSLETIGCSVSLREIFDRVEFPPEAETHAAPDSRPADLTPCKALRMRWLPRPSPCSRRGEKVCVSLNREAFVAPFRGLAARSPGL